jgi:hypothetical protein
MGGDFCCFRNTKHTAPARTELKLFVIEKWKHSLLKLNIDYCFCFPPANDANKSIHSPLIIQYCSPIILS